MNGVSRLGIPYHQAMVIGGKGKFVQGTLATKLSMYNVAPEMDWHVDMEKSARDLPSKLPANCTVLIVFMDMIAARSSIQHLLDDASAKGVKILRLSRHAARWPEEMHRQGFEPINPNIAEALREPERSNDVPVPKNQEEIGVTVVETPAPVLPDSFTSRMHKLVSLIRDMRIKDGVHTIMWTNGEKVTVERVQKLDVEV